MMDEAHIRRAIRSMQDAASMRYGLLLKDEVCRELVMAARNSLEIELPIFQSVPAMQEQASTPFHVSNSSPRVMPVNMPFSTFGVTIAILDGNGNVTIKVDQVPPENDKGSSS